MMTARAMLLATLLATILAACRSSPTAPDRGQPDSGGDAGGNPDGSVGTLASITLTALKPEIDVGNTLHFDAEARDATGALLPGIAFAWRSSNVAAGIIVDGDLVGIAPGNTLVTAESGGITSAAALVRINRMAPIGGPSSGERIDAALTAGAIDEETALIYKVFAAFGDARLPEEYLGDDRGVFETQALLTMNERFEFLSPATQATLKPFLLRPSSTGSWADRGSGAPGLASPGRGSQLISSRPTCDGTRDTWATVSTAAAKVKVWYDTAVLGHKHKAEIIADAVENHIWPKLIGTLGFKEPVDDTSLLCDGGDGRLDIYVVTALRGRGLTQPEPSAVWNGHHGKVYVMIRGDDDAELPGAVAHEFMHAIQWAYTTQADQDVYKWLKEATANWAIDSVYGKGTVQTERQYAQCFTVAPELPLQDTSAGYCSDPRAAGSERFYGAYLFFQYVSHASGEQTVKNVIESMERAPTAVEAVNLGLGGGKKLKETWPEFAKALWNTDPIKSFDTWDDMREVPDTREVVGDLGGQTELKEVLEPEQNDLSARYYHFTFADPNTRSVLFQNGFFDHYKAGKAIKILAVWRDAGGNWHQEDDWAKYEFVGLCRDMRLQRVMDLTIIVANGEWTPSGGGKLTATKDSYLKRNNIGCWQYKGTTNMVHKDPSWSGAGRLASSNVVFSAPAGAERLDSTSPLFPDALRANIIFDTAGTDYTFTVSYTSGTCTFSAGPVSFPLAMPVAGGFLLTNPFPELKSSDPGITDWMQQAPRAYQATVTSTRMVTVNVSGTACGTNNEDMVGGFLLTNDSQNDHAINPPVAQQNGDFTGTFPFKEFSFTWSVQPQIQP